MDASAELSAARRADIQSSLYVLTAPGFTCVRGASKAERLQSTANVPVTPGWVNLVGGSWYIRPDLEENSGPGRLSGLQDN